MKCRYWYNRQWIVFICGKPGSFVTERQINEYTIIRH